MIERRLRAIDREGVYLRKRRPGERASGMELARAAKGMSIEKRLPEGELCAIELALGLAARKSIPSTESPAPPIVGDETALRKEIADLLAVVDDDVRDLLTEYLHLAGQGRPIHLLATDAGMAEQAAIQRIRETKEDLLDMLQGERSAVLQAAERIDYWSRRTGIASPRTRFAPDGVTGRRTATRMNRAGVLEADQMRLLTMSIWLKPPAEVADSAICRAAAWAVLRIGREGNDITADALAASTPGWDEIVAREPMSSLPWAIRSRYSLSIGQLTRGAVRIPDRAMMGLAKRSLAKPIPRKT